ncbi:unnamed protein product, partial [Didymodactylos carnosus]
HGSDIGSLLIWTIENTTASAKETLIWQQNGAQGNEWLIERINLWPTEDYYFRIDGYVGDSFLGATSATTPPSNTASLNFSLRTVQLFVLMIIAGLMASAFS